MATCVFCGHRDFYYAPYQEQLRKIIIDLIENKGVTEFYNGYLGNFDFACADIVYGLKKHYPNMKLLPVLSYHPKPDFKIPSGADESVYLLESQVPPKYAISRTNRRLVCLADYIVSGVRYPFGGAYSACSYAKRLQKEVIELKFDQE